MKPRSRPRRVALRAILAFVGGASSHACQADTAPSQGALCTYGQQIPCLDAGAGCTQTCLPDLSDYGPCTCGHPGTDAGDGGKRDAR